MRDGIKIERTLHSCCEAHTHTTNEIIQEKKSPAFSCHFTEFFLLSFLLSSTVLDLVSSSVHSSSSFSFFVTAPLQIYIRVCVCSLLFFRPPFLLGA